MPFSAVLRALVPCWDAASVYHQLTTPLFLSTVLLAATQLPLTAADIQKHPEMVKFEGALGQQNLPNRQSSRIAYTKLVDANDWEITDAMHVVAARLSRKSYRILLFDAYLSRNSLFQATTAPTLWHRGSARPH